MFGIGLQEVILLLPLAIVYLLASVTLVPFVASTKGRSRLAWMLISLLMSPLLAAPHRAGCRATRRRPGADQSFRRRAAAVKIRRFARFAGHGAGFGRLYASRAQFRA